MPQAHHLGDGTGGSRSLGQAFGYAQRDLRSAVTRVANLLGDEPAGIVLDLPAISSRLNTINPLALGFTAKRFANIRSDFLAAARLCGAKAVANREAA